MTIPASSREGLRVACVVGARPNFMKIAPLLRAFSGVSDIRSELIHTGQHYDDSMSGAFFRDLDIPQPDVNLGVGSGSHAYQTGRVMEALESHFARSRPYLTVVVGDVNSTMAAALVSAKMGIPVAHVEAGLRSFDRTMPEEINRVVTDSVADFLFTTCQDADENLLREGVRPEIIHLVGNLMIDTLLAALPRVEKLHACRGFDLLPRSYAVLTLHRDSNVDSLLDLVPIVRGLVEISRSLPILFPMHPRTGRLWDEATAACNSAEASRVTACEPLPYLEFISLVRDARLVLTDSGGLQEETAILGVPCLTLRENTERPITIEAGTNHLVGTTTEAMVAQAERVLSSPMPGPCEIPFWDGKAAARVRDVICRHFDLPVVVRRAAS